MKRETPDVLTAAVDDGLAKRLRPKAIRHGNRDRTVSCRFM
jgi:hypothetical protein